MIDQEIGKVGVIPIDGDRWRFSVWAPKVENIALKLVKPVDKVVPLSCTQTGHWEATVAGISDETRYYYEIDNTSHPDPASRYQPDGVHGPSAVVDHRQYDWQDSDWRNPALADYVIYELHVGTFTKAGTFDAAIEQLSALKELGITAVEIMPIAQFPGERNWGYDGVYPYAVQNSYGGPDGLKRLVEACHAQGMAVILDVVYNHFGPEGNYTGNFAPFVTPKYKTPWGGAINFDDTWSDGVRHYFVQNALAWLEDYHIDALRLDAIHAIYDFGARHFLAELSEKVDELSARLDKSLYLIAESDLNDTRIIRDRDQGGFGLHAQWSDDFHHALHTLLTAENKGYYEDFGTCEALAIALRERFVYSWKYSKFRKRFHGSVATDYPSSQFVICAQNHDQIGNRMMGDRLTHLVSFEGLKLSAGLLLTAPYVPMLFMGEEYGEDAPFLYFIDHSDPDLLEAVRCGRAEEFKDFQGEEEPPDASDPQTYEKSKLNWSARYEGKQQQLWHFYQRLIQLRKQLQLGKDSVSDDLSVFSEEQCKVVYYQRELSEGYLLCLMNFSQHPSTVKLPTLQGPWQKQISSADAQWGGPGDALPNTLEAEKLTLPPQSFALYQTVH